MSESERIALLETALRNMIAIAEFCAPSPAHEGSCGPWEQCDGQCGDAANCAQTIRAAQKILKDGGK